MQLRFPLQCEEEEEGGGGGGGGYFSNVPKNIEELAEWWEHCTNNICHPLYAFFIASNADSEVVALVRDNREELRIISGKDCCFIYFREISRAVSCQEWSFLEHAKAALPVGQMLGIQSPALIFFEDISMNNFAIVPLHGLSAYEQLLLLRRIFATFYRLSGLKPIYRIKRASESIYLKKVADGVLGKADVSVNEFFKLIGKSCASLFW